MDLDRIRKLAGLPTDSTQAPSQIREDVKSDDSEVITESTKVDFSAKDTSNLIALEEAIAEKAGQNITLSEDGKDALADVDALGLKRVGTVVDLGRAVFIVYEGAEPGLWFQHTDGSNTIVETSLTMDELKEFHKGEDVVMRESDEKKKKPDADGDGVPDWADKKPGKDDKKCPKEEIKHLRHKMDQLDKNSDDYVLDAGRLRDRIKRLKL